MERVLTELCDYLNNYFWVKKKTGSFTISNGAILGLDSDLKDGQYFRIVGSVFNDAVHKYPTTNLVDETFEGAIWAMAVPPTVIALASDIADWQAKYGSVDSVNMSPYTSESFGNYSYSKDSAGGGDSSSAASNSWQAAFAARLQKWRRLRGAE